MRRLADRIGTCRALTVHAAADADTWIGPTPQHCHEMLLTVRRHLLTQREQLQRTALAFDRHAAELERLPPPHTVGLT